MPITNFPDGASSYGIPLVGAGPVIPSGNVFFVGPNGGNGAGRGTKDEPFLTLAYALTQCTAAKNDVIFLMAGYTETISAAGGLDINKSGVTIIGLGNDDNRPRFTFGTSTGASMVISAANVSISNIVGVAGIDGLTKPFHVQASGCKLNIEWQDASSTVEAATAVLTTTGADLFELNLKYVGFPAGNATVSAVQLNGCNNGRINVDFYGVVSTAVVEFVTTLSNNIIVTGNVYTSGVTNQSRIVVDTITSSIWFAYGYDATADVGFIGGNVTGITVAPSISAVTDALYGSTGIAAWPTAAAYANGVSIAEVLAYIQDGVRRGSGTIMAANKSIADALGTDGATVTDSAVTVIGPIGANNANNAFSSASVVANADGSVLERLEHIQAASEWRMATKTSASPLTTGTIFTFAGSVEFKIIGRVTTEIQAQATTVKLSLVCDALAAYDICGTLDINAFDVGSLISITGTAANNAVGTDARGALAPFQTNSVVATCVTSGTITVTFGAASTGAIAWEILWRPLSAAGSVAAA